MFGEGGDGVGVFCFSIAVGGGPAGAVAGDAGGVPFGSDREVGRWDFLEGKIDAGVALLNELALFRNRGQCAFSFKNGVSPARVAGCVF